MLLLSTDEYLHKLTFALFDSKLLSALIWKHTFCAYQPNCKGIKMTSVFRHSKLINHFIYNNKQFNWNGVFIFRELGLQIVWRNSNSFSLFVRFMIEVMQLPNSLCIHIKGIRQMLYCNPIFNQYIISKSTDCGKKKKVQFILLISMMHASCPRGKEGKLIYRHSIFLFIFQLFSFYQL